MTDVPYNEDTEPVLKGPKSAYDKLPEEIKDHMTEDEWLWLSDREKGELEDVWFLPEDDEDVEDIFV